MSINTGRNQIQTITKELLNQWSQTKEHWYDRRSQEFEEKYMSQLLPTMNSAVEAIGQLSKILAKIRKDCE